MDELFERVDCCVTPVLRFEESIENEQLQARGMIVEVAGVKQFAPPFKISELPFEARLPPPAAGEHSENPACERLQRRRDRRHCARRK
jgi:alpha-methylacyl-CoA racemase